MSNIPARLIEQVPVQHLTGPPPIARAHKSGTTLLPDAPIQLLNDFQPLPKAANMITLP